MPVFPAEPVATTLVCYLHFAHEAAGAAGTRHSLRPPYLRDNDRAKLGRIAPRERERMSRLFENGIRNRAVRTVNKFTVMPGLVPGIHVLLSFLCNKDVDGRDKPGHDEMNNLKSASQHTASTR